MPNNRKPCAVFIDGSALFLASRAIADALRPEEAGERAPRLDYRRLIDVLKKNVEGLTDPDPQHRTSIWSMWTAYAADNPGQAAFLEFTEKNLRWDVRRFSPMRTFMVEPSAIFGVGSEPGKASRLMRFDAAIAYAIGSLAESHRIIVISDSYPLVEPLMRVGDRTNGGKPVLAFFGRAIDPRWWVTLREEAAPEFINLDDFQTELFGLPVNLGELLRAKGTSTGFKW